MAKQLIRTYTFAPGSPGIIVIPGKWDLNQILLITNATRNVFLYNFADATYSGTSVSFSRANSTAFPTTLNNTDGLTTITLTGNTSAQSASDNLQIFVERNEVITRPWPMGTDAFERTRVAAPKAMIDADFEYGLQPTKWQTLETLRNYPSFYEVPGTEISNISITTNASGGPTGSATSASLITIVTPSPHYLTAGTAIAVKGLLSGVTAFSRAEGSFLINTVPNGNAITYFAKGKVGTTDGERLDTVYAQIRRAALFTGSAISTGTFSIIGGGVSSTATIQVSFPTDHGLFPGATIYTQLNSDNGSNNHVLAQGSFFVTTVTNTSTVQYSARAPGSITGTPIGVVYARPDCFFQHRPFDGGVQLGTGNPTYMTSAVRMSKKYIRYQSGKSINYNTGALFAPNYDIRSITATNTIVGSTVFVTTDDVDHGLQPTAVIQLQGVTTTGYNVTATVTSVIDERTFTYITNTALSATTAVLGTPCLMSHVSWHGSTVRAGTFDEQNGMFWQYDGSQMALGQRTSTLQTAGTITVIPDSNLIVGQNTRFTDQLVAGDRVVIRGMTHSVSKVTSATWLSVTPDYRGITTSTGVKMLKTRDILYPQNQWNLDRCDGTNGVYNPSGYLLLPNKMQMIGMQWTWYGAGFIDWMLRGPDGNYLTVHRQKNSNVNTEAYMRSGNMPVRYEVINEGARSQITTGISSAAVAMTVTDVTYFPNTGTVYIDNELISFTGKNTTTSQLTGLTRGTTLGLYAGGTTRTFSAAGAVAHTTNTGVMLISQTATPTISHWGSAMLQDGGFDEDRGYIFNYQASNISAQLRKTTAFAIRLAPSVSNALVGDLGQRELINRAQLLLQSVAVTAGAAGANQAIVVEGVLNPSNYPTTATNIVWKTLTSGGQPSFSQIADGRDIAWDNTATILGVSFTGVANVTGTVTVSVNTTATIRIGDSFVSTGTAGGTIITAIGAGVLTLSQPLPSAVGAGQSITVTRNQFATPGETIFSFINSPSGTDSLDLSALKELTNTPLGGRGAFPNGPDVLAINVYVTQGQNILSNLVLRWGEAQA